MVVAVGVRCTAGNTAAPSMVWTGPRTSWSSRQFSVVSAAGFDFGFGAPPIAADWISE